MAITPVQVQIKQGQKKDTLDKILAGVTIANQILGTAVSVDKLTGSEQRKADIAVGVESKKLQQQQAFDTSERVAKQEFSAGQTKFKEEQANRRSGLLPGLGGNLTPKETPGEKALSQATAKEYADYVASGGSATAASHIKNIAEVIDDLKSGAVTTGGISDMTPDWARKKLNSSGVAAQQKVVDSVMSSLRQTLGPQFTEREGEKILSTSFDQNLPVEHNIPKLEKLKSRLEQMAQAKADAMTYFEENGSMKGYKGQIYSPNRDGASQKVKVSNGKETLIIDPKDISAAEKDGYKRVQ